MKPIQTFTVTPSLPSKIQYLQEIARNLLWSWDRETIDLLRRLERDLWNETEHNPMLMMGKISQSQLEALAIDEAFIAHMERVSESLNDYMTAPGWYEKTYGKHSEHPIAYFSAEFGITESIPIYSGGLGILAGDYLKSSSDLGLPMVGVGLLYQKGYFRQYLNSDGWQQEEYPDSDFYNLCIKQEKNQDGTPVTITVDYPNGPVMAQIWRAQIGRVPLYLLDTNIPANSRLEDREITGRLYVSDAEARIRWEIMLGCGGVIALEKLGIQPSVYHMNEGHSAFLTLERISQFMTKHGLSFNEAKEIVSATNVFTTHTPEPAGIDIFYITLIEKYLTIHCNRLGISFNELLALGRQDPSNKDEWFSMAVLALRLASYRNGVSKLHGEVSRKMWNNMWPGVPENEVPIGYVTNGIHIRSWVSNDIEGLFDRYVGQWWAKDPSTVQIWDRIKRIPDDELWRTHERRRERLVAFARKWMQNRLERRGATQSEIIQAGEVLDPEALTIGFARRFASYKRAKLLMQDTERLANILCDKKRPVQIIYAGKSHPDDNRGKELIREIIHNSRLEEFKNHIIFLEDYDMNIARYLIQGCDLWLSNPRRLREASGTSGMKAGINGVLNISILDGWWYEAYKPEIGWAIGNGEDYDNESEQSEVESDALYDILEKEVIPLFYDTGNNGIPRKWIARMKEAMVTICKQYNTDRMVNEYIMQFYHPCIKHWEALSENKFAITKQEAAWKSYIRQNWSSVRIDSVKMDEVSDIRVGSQIAVIAKVYLGALKPEDVAVEIYEGNLDPHKRTIINAESIHMDFIESHGNGNYTFKGVMRCNLSGLYGYSVRVLPKHDDPNMHYEPGLITWASQL
ncbi:MAG: glycogen phosphorylase [Candidatus Poribacteria bacterium]|nr:glycogen phosphorylase [Candidatus Poribacteria bacterium]